jgi:hypothetical protein
MGRTLLTTAQVHTINTDKEMACSTIPSVGPVPLPLPPEYKIQVERRWEPTSLYMLVLL